MSDLFSVTDKTVIVTGSARGNGKAIASGFHEHGAVVFFVDILEEVHSLVAGLNDSRAFGICCDLTDQLSISDLVDKVVEKTGRIDVLVNNAGVSLQKSELYDDEVWERTFAVNLNAAFRLSRRVVSVMKQQKHGGAIINITSLGAELGFPGNPAYVSSKGALRQFTKALAMDFGQYNIRANNVCPGYIRTNMTSRSYNDSKLKEERDRRIILGRWGESADLVGACIFLASDASSYITGIDLPVDGGWLARGL